MRLQTRRSRLSNVSFHPCAIGTPSLGPNAVVGCRGAWGWARSATSLGKGELCNLKRPQEMLTGPFQEAAMHESTVSPAEAHVLRCPLHPLYSSLPPLTSVPASVRSGEVEFGQQHPLALAPRLTHIITKTDEWKGKLQPSKPFRGKADLSTS